MRHNLAALLPYRAYHSSSAAYPSRGANTRLKLPRTATTQADRACTWIGRKQCHPSRGSGSGSWDSHRCVPAMAAGHLAIVQNDCPLLKRLALRLRRCLFGSQRQCYCCRSGLWTYGLISSCLIASVDAPLDYESLSAAIYVDDSFAKGHACRRIKRTPSCTATNNYNTIMQILLPMSREYS